MEEKLDAELVRLARAADKQAFQELIERYQVMALYLALRYCHQEETARELIQEAILQAYLSLDRLHDETRFRSWFYGIVLNVCRSWQRTWRQKQAFSLEAQANERSSEPLFSDTTGDLLFVDPQEIVEERELRDLVRQALNMLSLNNRQVVYFFYYQDRSIQEIAHSLNISPMAVKSRLHKGRAQLRMHLQSLLPDFASRVTNQGKESSMIPVKIAGVMQKRYVGTTVILLDERNRRALPLRFPKSLHPNPLRRMHTSAQEDSFEEPTTADFMAELLALLGGELQEVAIDALQGYILYAQLHLHTMQGQRTINAHLHDALPLALQLHCPFLVSEQVFKQKGIDLKKKGPTLEQQLDAMTEQDYYSSNTPGMRISGDLEFSQGLAGWTISGDRKYLEYHLDAATTYTGKPSLAIILQGTEHQGYMQLKHEDIAADAYRGQRVRLIAYVKTEDVKVAGFDLVIEASPRDPEQKFPDIYTTRTQEALRGTHDWTRQELVIDIPEGAYMLRPIFSMWRRGKAWLDGIHLEVVEKSVLPTGTRLIMQVSPLNLDFSQGLEFWQCSQWSSSWVIEGGTQQEYQCGIERTTEGTACAFLKAVVEQPRERVELKQSVFATQRYAGKHTRLSATIKTADSASASLFLNCGKRAQGHARHIITGTTDWTRYTLAIDVPKKWGQTVSLGISLHGQGQIWVKDIQMEALEQPSKT